MSGPFSIVPDILWEHQFSTRGKCSADGCKRDAVEGGTFCQIHTKPGRMRPDVDAWESGLSYIYAVRCKDFVKIGQTISPKKRLSTLQSANPFDLTYLGDVRAPGALEFAIHEYLKSDRHRLEWFRVSPRVARVVGLIVGGKAVELASMVGLCSGYEGDPT